MGGVGARGTSKLSLLKEDKDREEESSQKMRWELLKVPRDCAMKRANSRKRSLCGRKESPVVGSRGGGREALTRWKGEDASPERQDRHRGIGWR